MSSIAFTTREPIGSSTYPMPDLAWQPKEYLTALNDLPAANNKIATLYVHIPFCDQICSFCGFNKYVSTEEKKAAYLKALCLELEFYAVMPHVKALEIGAVYLGGGTPNSLTPQQLKILITHIRSNFNLIADCEITCEGTPQNFTDECLAVLKETGVNRISAGIQTLETSIRKNYLNMNYTESEVIGFINHIQNNFENFNLDFIYNLPKQTFDIWDNDLNVALASHASHLTLYPLVLLEKTAFYTDYVKRSKHNIPPQEKEIEFFKQTCKKLSTSAFKPYTIRDWSKTNKHCRYIYLNANCHQVLAFGAGAHGFIAGMTYRNYKNIGHYIELIDQQKTLPVEAYRTCHLSHIMQRFMVMGLRLWQLDMQSFNDRFNQNWQSVYGEKIGQLVDSDYLILNENKITFTEKGHIWANNVRTFFEEKKTASVGYSDSIGIGESGKDHYNKISRIKASADIEANT